MIALALLLVSLPAEPVAAGALERAILGKSAVVDLTHPLTDRAAFPTGQEVPRQDASDEADRNAPPQCLSVPTELGTVLRLPAMAVKGKGTVAQIPARELLAHAVVVDISIRVSQVADYQATVGDLQAWERRHGRIPKGSVVLLYTGWARRWGDPVRYVNLDAQGIPRVPGFSPAALTFLVNERDVRGVGLDTFVPVMPSGSGGDSPCARLPKGKWQLVNLTNLESLPVKGAKLVIAPLRLEAGHAPARVIAILP